MAMYIIQRTIPNEITIEVKGKATLGLMLFITGAIGEILTIYAIFFIIMTSSFAESSFILNLLGSGALPFSFFINFASGICLVVSFKELFYRNGWTIRNQKSKSEVNIIKYKKFLFLSSKTVIKIESVISWTIQSIYFDELKYFSRERIIIEYKDHIRNEVCTDTVIEFTDENSKKNVLDLLNDIEKIIGNNIPIKQIESGLNSITS